MVPHVKPQAKALVFLYDMGETSALNAPIRKLHEQGVKVHVVAMGTASANLHSFHYRHMSVARWKALKSVTRDHWKRDRQLAPKQLKSVLTQIRRQKPDIIITGTVSAVQVQLVEEAIRHSLIAPDRVVAYYDNPSSPIKGSQVEPLVHRLVVNHCHLLVPSQKLADEFEGAVAVGNPNVDVMAERIQDVCPSHIRAKLGIHELAPVITYIGGYGDGSEEALQLFARALRKIEKDEDRRQIELARRTRAIVLVHPKQQGIEREKLPETRHLRGAGINNFILPMSQLSTAEALATASLTLSFRSTLTSSALLAGIPSHFMSKQPQSNLLLQAELCKNIGTSKELQPMMEMGIQTPTVEEIRERSGLLANSSERIFKYLLSVVENSL